MSGRGGVSLRRHHRLGATEHRSAHVNEADMAVQLAFRVHDDHLSTAPFLYCPRNFQSERSLAVSSPAPAPSTTTLEGPEGAMLPSQQAIIELRPLVASTPANTAAAAAAGGAILTTNSGQGGTGPTLSGCGTGGGGGVSHGASTPSHDTSCASPVLPGGGEAGCGLTPRAASAGDFVALYHSHMSSFLAAGTTALSSSAVAAAAAATHPNTNNNASGSTAAGAASTTPFSPFGYASSSTAGGGGVGGASFAATSASTAAPTVGGTSTSTNAPGTASMMMAAAGADHAATPAALLHPSGGWICRAVALRDGDSHTHGAISVHQSLATRCPLVNEASKGKVMARLLHDYADVHARYGLSHVELSFERQFISRSDLFLVSEALREEVLYEGQEVSYGGFTLKVRALVQSFEVVEPPHASAGRPLRASSAIPVGGGPSPPASAPVSTATDMDSSVKSQRHVRVRCGVVTPDTRINFVSLSPLHHLILELSQEMWATTMDGRNSLTWAINKFLGDLLTKQLPARKASPLLRVVFTGRLKPDAAAAAAINASTSTTPCRDVFHILDIPPDRRDVDVVEEIRLHCEALVHRLLREVNFGRGRVGHTALSSGADIFTPARESNTLEALGLVLEQVGQTYVNRRLDNMAYTLTIVSAGKALYRAQNRLVQVCCMRLHDLGLEHVHVVCIGRPPLHTTPLLEYSSADDTLRAQYHLDTVYAVAPHQDAYISHDGEMGREHHHSSHHPHAHHAPHNSPTSPHRPALRASERLFFYESPLWMRVAFYHPGRVENLGQAAFELLTKSQWVARHGTAITPAVASTNVAATMGHLIPTAPPPTGRPPMHPGSPPPAPPTPLSQPQPSSTPTNNTNNNNSSTRLGEEGPGVLIPGLGLQPLAPTSLDVPMDEVRQRGPPGSSPIRGPHHRPSLRTETMGAASHSLATMEASLPGVRAAWYRYAREGLTGPKRSHNNPNNNNPASPPQAGAASSSTAPKDGSWHQHGSPLQPPPTPADSPDEPSWSADHSSPYHSSGHHGAEEMMMAGSGGSGPTFGGTSPLAPGATAAAPSPSAVRHLRAQPSPTTTEVKQLVSFQNILDSDLRNGYLVLELTLHPERLPHHVWAPQVLLEPAGDALHHAHPLAGSSRWPRLMQCWSGGPDGEVDGAAADFFQSHFVANDVFCRSHSAISEDGRTLMLHTHMNSTTFFAPEAITFNPHPELFLIRRPPTVGEVGERATLEVEEEVSATAPAPALATAVSAGHVQLRDGLLFAIRPIHPLRDAEVGGEMPPLPQSMEQLTAAAIFARRWQDRHPDTQEESAQGSNWSALCAARILPLYGSKPMYPKDSYFTVSPHQYLSTTASSASGGSGGGGTNTSSMQSSTSSSGGVGGGGGGGGGVGMAAHTSVEERRRVVEFVLQRLQQGFQMVMDSGACNPIQWLRADPSPNSRVELSIGHQTHTLKIGETARSLYVSRMLHRGMYSSNSRATSRLIYPFAVWNYMTDVLEPREMTQLGERHFHWERMDYWLQGRPHASIPRTTELRLLCPRTRNIVLLPESFGMAVAYQDFLHFIRYRFSSLLRATQTSRHNMEWMEDHQAVHLECRHIEDRDNMPPEESKMEGEASTPTPGDEDPRPASIASAGTSATTTPAATTSTSMDATTSATEAWSTAVLIHDSNLSTERKQVIDSNTGRVMGYEEPLQQRLMTLDVHLPQAYHARCGYPIQLTWLACASPLVADWMGSFTAHASRHHFVAIPIPALDFDVERDALEAYYNLVLRPGESVEDLLQTLMPMLMDASAGYYPLSPALCPSSSRVLLLHATGLSYITGSTTLPTVLRWHLNTSVGHGMPQQLALMHDFQRAVELARREVASRAPTPVAWSGP